MAMKFAEKFLNMMTLNNDSDDDYDEYDDEYEEVDDNQEVDEDEDYDEDYEEEEEEDEELPYHAHRETREAKESKEEIKKPILSFKHKMKDIEEKRDSEAETPRRVIQFQGRREGESEIVKVIKPQEFNEAQGIVDELKQGKTIVVNLEGLEISQAQRIMDFVGGASYIIDGSLNAISNNIFIVAPDNIEVSGDLKSEIVNKAILSPELV